MIVLLLGRGICGIHSASALMFFVSTFVRIFQVASIFPMSILKSFGTMESEILIGVSLFVFTVTILEKSEIAEGVY